MVLMESIGALIIALSILYIYYKFVIFNFWRKRGVFYVKPIVPIGNISELVFAKRNVGEWLHDIYVKHKDHGVIGIYTFYKPNLIIADLDLIRIVMTKEFMSFHDRGIYCNEKVDPLSGHLVFLSGKKWQTLRVKMTPTFTSKKIKQMFANLKECAENVTKHMESIARMKDSIDIKDLFSRYTIDIIMSATMGIKSNCIEEPNNEYHKMARKSIELHPFWATLAAFTPQILDFFSIPLTESSVSSSYMNIFRESVKNRQRHNIVRQDFMNLLIQLMEKGYVESDDGETPNESLNMSKLTMEEAAAQSFIFFIAGFSTSSITATFTLYELTQNQNIQDKLRQEIDETLAKHGDLTYDAVNEMTYLHKVINETLRKYPPIPFLNRICTKDITLPTTNIHIPKGTTITIPLLGLHRDPSIYPDPDKFDPERFNADVIAKRHPYAYMPFGEGPRICIGFRFGQMQIKIGLVSLLSKYKFYLHPRTQVPLQFVPNTFPLVVKGDVHLIIEPR